MTSRSAVSIDWVPYQSGLHSKTLHIYTLFIVCVFVCMGIRRMSCFSRFTMGFPWTEFRLSLFPPNLSTLSPPYVIDSVSDWTCRTINSREFLSPCPPSTGVAVSLFQVQTQVFTPAKVALHHLILILKTRTFSCLCNSIHTNIVQTDNEYLFMFGDDANEIYKIHVPHPDKYAIWFDFFHQIL